MSAGNDECEKIKLFDMWVWRTIEYDGSKSLGTKISGNGNYVVRTKMFFNESIKNVF